MKSRQKPKGKCFIGWVMPCITCSSFLKAQQKIPKQTIQIDTSPCSSPDKSPRKKSGNSAPLASPAWKTVLAMHEEKERLESIQKEMEEIRQKKIQRYVEDHYSKEVEQQQVFDTVKQQELKEKAEQARIEEEWRIQQREKEQARIRKQEAESAKKREEEKKLLMDKLESGKKMSDYERQMVQTLLQVPGCDETVSGPKARKLVRHPSVLTDKPETVGKLNASASEDVLKVMVQLQNLHEQKIQQAGPMVTLNGVVRKSPSQLVTPKEVIDYVSNAVEQLEEGEFRLNGIKSFDHLSILDRKEALTDIAKAIASKAEDIELLEMFACGLEDAFLIQLARDIHDRKYTQLQELHLESNQFTGEGMKCLFEAVAVEDNVPCLNSIKITNQKSVDAACSLALLNALKSNPSINRITFDWIKQFDAAEANNLLARNGAIAKGLNKSTISKSFSNLTKEDFGSRSLRVSTDSQCGPSILRLSTDSQGDPGARLSTDSQKIQGAKIATDTLPNPIQEAE
eukprot:TRINITY_DN9686_c0_g1_i2.p1 TRINITY_DN9686_c0_g1~~TRINITY_DN9686_c0_g1_i2.p1  ORF type:complete len:513 (+),score=134.47 TRINITY_DN9686_c0_g1_i2:3016-4554(+)